MNQLAVQSLYIRFFDVGMEGAEVVPLGVLNAFLKPANDLQYVPVVFIKQNILYRLQEKDLKPLAEKIAGLIASLCEKYKIRPDEIQIDCDWTKETRALYFQLLNELKEQSFFKGKLVSCTIRMHQVKYVISSGIPPVDKGLLMVYNMGNLTKYGGHNSILEVKETKDYLNNIQQYPLPIDIALPLYHWAILFELGAFKGIVYNLSKSDFPTDVLIRKEGDLYRLKRDIQISGYSFKKDAELRFENPSKNALRQVTRFLAEKVRGNDFRLLLFHLDSTALRQFSARDIQDIIQTMQ